MIDPMFERQLEQALSKGALSPGEIQSNWWNRYLIDRQWFSVGMDLTDWALPLQIAAGSGNLHIRFLFLDIDFYWGYI